MVGGPLAEETDESVRLVWVGCCAVDGRGVRSVALRPRPSHWAMGFGVPSIDSEPPGITIDVSNVSGLLSRRSRCAPLPSSATFLSDPLRRRVLWCL